MQSRADLKGPRFPARWWLSILLAAFCAGCVTLAAAGPLDGRIVFTNVSTDAGLSQGAVRTIYQDRRGYIWLVTGRGLTRFDGFELREFAVPLENEVVWSNEIRGFAEDQYDRLWVGTTGGGVIRMEPETGGFTHFRSAPGESESLSSNFVTALQEQRDPAGKITALWVGTENGLNRFNHAQQTFERIPLKAGGGDEFILGLSQGSDGSIWAATAHDGLFLRAKGSKDWTSVWDKEVGISAIGSNREMSAIWVATTDGGILQFSVDGELAKRIEHAPLLKLFDGNVGQARSLLEDSEGSLWVGTAQGVDQCDLATERWSTHRHSAGDDTSLVNGPILSLFEDERKVVWFGAGGGGGVSRFSLRQSWFSGYGGNSNEADSLSDPAVHTFAEAADGRIWIGTENGLNRFDPSTGEFEVFRHDRDNPASLPRNYVYLTLVDRRDRLWVATRGGGLARLEPGSSEFQVVRRLGTSGETGSVESITAILEDHQGVIWVGILDEGIARWDESSDTFTAVGPGGELAALRHVTDLHEDQEGRLWVATAADGLWELDRDSGIATRRLAGGDTDADKQLPAKPIAELAGGRNGVLWIATLGGGFAAYDPDTGEVNQFKRENSELTNDDAFSILEDDEGLVWVATGQGLVRFDRKEGGFRRFGLPDGLEHTAFYPKSALRARNGRFYFGGPKGFNIIDPSNFPAPLSAPRPVLTTLRLYGFRVEPGEDQVLKKPLAATDRFRVSHDKLLTIGIGFGSLDYATDGRARFQYRLEGFDSGWRDAGELREANYSGAPPGAYRFVVRASADGWSWAPDQPSVKIVVAPPWYQTREAILGAIGASVLLLGMLALGIYRWRIAQERERHQQLLRESSETEAALSRQIQHSMLLEQTSAEFRRSLDPMRVFDASLERIATQFGSKRCFIAATQSGDGGTVSILSEVFHPPLGSLRNWRIPVENSYFQRLMSSDEPLTLRLAAPGDPEAKPIAEMMGDERVQRLLAVRTAHLDQANGMIVLHDVDPQRKWRPDEVKMIQSLAGQFGLAMAQLQLAEREAGHRQELEVAQRTAEEARNAADQANQAKSDFLATMSHEVRTPLNAIIGFSEVISRDSGLTPDLRENMGIVNSAGEHLLGVINDILEISKIEAGGSELTLDVFELEKMLQSVAGMISVKARAKGITMEVVRLTELPAWIEADEGKLRQVLLNLLGNGVKFADEGGVALRVGVKSVEADEEPSFLQTQGRNLRLEFEIFDTGPGMSQEDLSRLFQKFVQTESGKRAAEGTGLGLAISKGFVELMEGEIGVMSQPGFGTLFTVEIPCREHFRSAQLVSAAAAADRGAVIGLRPGHEEVRVLIAEDQPVNRLLLHKFLAPAGFTLKEAEDGVEAIEMWRRWRPHLILMDEEMPRIRGTEATRVIMSEAAGERPPVIISLTGRALDDQKNAVLEAGCVDLLIKPFKRDDLFEMIARHLPVRYAYEKEKEKEKEVERAAAA